VTEHPYAVLDVFTETPLQGNPLAVFDEAATLSDDEMQQLARELNLSETAFLLPSQTDADARVRIFTPAAELPFAGHPVLGTAFLLAGQLGKNKVTLQTGAGQVPVEFTGSYGEMEQPLPTTEEAPEPTSLLDSLGVDRSELPIGAYRNGPLHVFVALPGESAVTAVSPNLQALSELGPCCVSCFALSDGHRRVKTRVFCPALGVPEDPATGSAAGPLALHLTRHQLLAHGEQLEIHQGQEIRRPSILFARVEGTADRIESVNVGGSAVEVARGRYRVA